MANEPQWLVSLRDATDYSQLQALFNAMELEAKHNSDPAAMAVWIDEAIRRIEMEKVRDTVELERFTEEYDAFKKEQSGALGWLKRKLPFTETRKKELGHRENVHDQTAEKLADGFTIARAEMLKERILPAESRRMGRHSKYWRDRFVEQESFAGIRNYGGLVESLGVERARAQAFVELMDSAIDGFSHAAFSEKEDRVRRDRDVAAAREEYESLLGEHREKESLRGSALKRLSTLVREELTQSDPSFRALATEADHLQRMLESAISVAGLLDQRKEVWGERIQNLALTQEIPKQRAACEDALTRLRREFDDTERSRARCITQSIELTNLHHAAKRDAGQAMQALEAAQANATDGAIAGLEAMQRELQTADEALNRVAVPLADVQRQIEEETRRAESIRKKIDQQQRELDALIDQERKVTQSLSTTRDRLQQLDPEFADAARRYGESLRNISTVAGSTALTDLSAMAAVPIELLTGVGNDGVASHTEVLPHTPAWSSVGSPSSSMFPSDSKREGPTLQRLLSLADSFAKQIKLDRDALERTLNQRMAAKKQALRERCVMLFSQAIAEELTETGG